MTYRHKISYLKVCLTERCDFHCIFCKFPNSISRQEELSIEELAKLVDGFVRLGIEHVRIVGCEPLLRNDIFDFIYMMSSSKRLKQISLTTNGFYLKDKALALKGAGLNRVNINLSSLDTEKFRKITGVYGAEKVIEGICAAKEAELVPIRINVSLLKGLNFDELEDFATLSILYPLDVRFIEYYPDSKNSADFRNAYIPGYMVKNNIEFAFGPLVPEKSSSDEGPATYYRINDAKGRIGFINPVTDFFCVHCNTVTLHNSGKLFPCLFSPNHIDLMEPLRNKEFKLLAERMRNCFEVKSQVNKETMIENLQGFSSSYE